MHLPRAVLHIDFSTNFVCFMLLAPLDFVVAIIVMYIFFGDFY